MFEGISRSKRRARPARLSDVFEFEARGRAVAGSSRPARTLQLAIKRGIDIGFALVALLALWMPILGVCIVFRRALVSIPTHGRDGKTFGRLSFRFQPGPFARFMSESGLDRLPELVNLLKGDLSLVGPAPDASGRGGVLTMRPGLIGPARPGYGENFSLLGDARIVVSVIFRRRH